MLETCMLYDKSKVHIHSHIFEQNAPLILLAILTNLKRLHYSLKEKMNVQRKPVAFYAVNRTNLK